MRTEQSPLDGLNVNINISKGKSSNEYADRFIPKKVCANLYNLYFADDKLEKSRKENIESNKVELKDKAKDKYEDLLKVQLLGNQNKGQENSQSKKKKIISFASESKFNRADSFLPKEDDLSPKPKSETQNKVYRKIPKASYKVLDAQGLLDDYYLNLVDWSSNNLVGVGLENNVYYWSAANSKVTRLCSFEDDNVCSVSWSQSGKHIAVGNSAGEVHIFDSNKQSCVRVFEGHGGRVGSIDWKGNIVATGSRDRTIMLRDVREARDSFCTLQGPAQEVCGVKWSFGEDMLASGGNDNKLFIWSLKQQKEITRFHEHQAAVKAIGWSPHDHNLLASGGGTADRCLKFWNTQTLEMINSVDTGSQVCNLMFSKNSGELVSTHGFSLNQIVVWDYPTMEKLQTLTGHSMRVLYLAMSPSGQNIVTGAGDETLRFWNVFPPAPSKVISFYSAEWS